MADKKKKNAVRVEKPRKTTKRTAAQGNVLAKLPVAMTGRASSAKTAIGDKPVFAYIGSLPEPQRSLKAAAAEVSRLGDGASLPVVRASLLPSVCRESKRSRRLSRDRRRHAAVLDMDLEP
jgi:hypothetical protein